MSGSGRKVRGGWIAPVLAAGAAAVWAVAGWPACGGSDGTPGSSCSPACSLHEICVEGICIVPDAFDEGASPEDATDTFEFTPVEASDEASGEEAGDEAVDAVEDGGSEIDVTGFNIGEACTSDTDCAGPGTPRCVTAIIVFGGSFEWPNGYCSSSCDSADVGSCGAGYICLSIPFIGWEGCLKTCTPGAPDECREAENYMCLDAASIPGGYIPASICAPSLF